MSMRYSSVQPGASALFIVIFVAILFMVMTLSFVQLMVGEQTRSIDDQLSQGAYDAALAGVEDGKRVLAACLQNGDASAECAAIQRHECSTIAAAGYANSTGDSNAPEVKVQSVGGVGAELDMAYTCVKISRETQDISSSMLANESVVYELNSTTPLTDITLAWFNKSNAIKQSPDSGGVMTNGAVDERSLLQFSKWASASKARPPIIRAQLIQSKSMVDPNSFDSALAPKTNSATIYLYPVPTQVSLVNTLPNTALFSIDGARRSGWADLIVPINCANNLDSVQLLQTTFACSAKLMFPAPIGGEPSDAASDRVILLRLSAIYAETDLSITPNNGGKFIDVQPSIDSTGRANDVFRRVSARVEPTDAKSQLYPRATVDINGNFCKTLALKPAGYDAGSCIP